MPINMVLGQKVILQENWLNIILIKTIPLIFASLFQLFISFCTQCYSTDTQLPINILGPILYLKK